MTQDEIDLIYDYLHENYEYRDGELYLLKDKTFQKRGHKIGVLTFPGTNKGYAHLNTAFYINKTNYAMPLSHAIYIFHHKEKPKYILYKDENRMNTNIENLVSCRLQDLHYRTISRYQGYKKDRGKYRVCVTATDYEGTIGRFDTPEIAKEIYLLARKILIEEDLTMQELRNKLSEIHPQVTKKVAFKRVLPYAYMTKKGKFDAKIKLGAYNLYFGSFETPLEAHYEAVTIRDEYKTNPSVIDKYIDQIKNNTGFIGVYSRGGAYFAQITLKKKLYTIGPFKTKEEAHDAYKTAKETKIAYEYDANQIVQVECIDCGTMTEVQIKNAYQKKYCKKCLKIRQKERDRSRIHTKKVARTICREKIEYILGYFLTQEESNQAFKEASELYDKDKEAFKLKYTKTRIKKSRTKEENRLHYQLYRNRNGKLTREQSKNA